MEKMNNINCDVARDLMPLVIDGVASAAAQDAVAAHVAGCVECQKVMEGMRQEEKPFSKDSDTQFIQLCKRMERQFTRLRLGVWLGLILLIAALLLGLGRFAYYQMNEHRVPIVFGGDVADSVKFYQDQFGYVYVQFEVKDALHPYIGSTGYTDIEDERRISHIIPEQSAWPHLFGSEGTTGIIDMMVFDEYQFMDGQLYQVDYASWMELGVNGVQVEHSRLISKLRLDELWLGEGDDALLLYSAADGELPPVVEQAAPGISG